MTSYFTIMQRASCDRAARRIAAKVADTGFPLERYLEFVLRGDRLITEETFADRASRWGGNIGSALGAVGGGALGFLGGGPVGTAALGAAGAGVGSTAGKWLGDKIGQWWGGRQDQANTGNPQYWQQQFNSALGQLNKVIQGMNQNLGNAEFAKTLKPEDMLKQVEQSVNQWKQTITQATAGHTKTADASNAAAAGDKVQQQVVGATGGQVTKTDTSTANPPVALPTAAPADGSGVVPQGHGTFVAPTGGNTQQHLATAAPSGIDATTWAPQSYMAGYSGPDPFAQNQTQTKQNAWNEPSGSVFSESRGIFRKGYRRIDPRIWG